MKKEGDEKFVVSWNFALMQLSRASFHLACRNIKEAGLRAYIVGKKTNAQRLLFAEAKYSFCFGLWLFVWNFYARPLMFHHLDRSRRSAVSTAHSANAKPLIPFDTASQLLCTFSGAPTEAFYRNIFTTTRKKNLILANEIKFYVQT